MRCLGEATLRDAAASCRGASAKPGEARRCCGKRLLVSRGRRGDTVADDLLSQIIQALRKRAARLNALRHGKIIVYVQDGRAIRLETSDSEKIEKGDIAS